MKRLLRPQIQALYFSIKHRFLFQLFYFLRFSYFLLPFYSPLPAVALCAGGFCFYFYLLPNMLRHSTRSSGIREAMISLKNIRPVERPGPGVGDSPTPPPPVVDMIGLMLFLPESH